jgi:hypothetical protein
VSFNHRRRLELKFVRGSVWDLDTPVGVLGVFKNVRPEGAATALDRQMAGAVSDLIGRRMFGADVGQVFVLPTPGSRVGPDIAVFVGLGDFDQFTDEAHRFAAANVVRTLARCRVDEFATVLFGARSDGGPVGVVEHMLGGFLDGLADADQGFRFRRIIVCELDRQRYDDARRAVRRLATAGFFGDVDVLFDEEDIPTREEKARAAEVAPAGAAPPTGDTTYLFVRTTPGETSTRYEFSVLAPTGGAVLVGRPTDVPTAAITNLLKTIDDPAFDVTRFGRDLAALVLPKDVAAALADDALKPTHLAVVHDREAARLPWETLRLGSHVPARVGGLSRRYATDLSVAKWLHRRRDNARLAILLVVNPTGDLPGAEKEGNAIAELLKQTGGDRVQVTRLEQDQATRDVLLREFESGRYDVIHYAGHAEFDPADPGRSGIRAAGGIPLVGRDLADLASLPGLFFCNACESGKIRGRSGKPSEPAETRLQKTVAFAEAFLVNGIAQFIGTYWPVGDESAETFATTFYGAILRGQTVGGALLGARTAVAGLKQNASDWADYMHYGDSKFVLKIPPAPGGSR